MQFHSGLVVRPGSPREQGQTEVDGGRIQSVDNLFQLQTELVLGVEKARLPNEDLGQVSIDAPVTVFVGMRQSVARDLAAEAHVVESRLHRTETSLDIAQALAVTQLGESKSQELVETGEALHLIVTAVAVHTAAEFIHW